MSVFWQGSGAFNSHMTGRNSTGASVSQYGHAVIGKVAPVEFVAITEPGLLPGKKDPT